jgi:transposase
MEVVGWGQYLDGVEVRRSVAEWWRRRWRRGASVARIALKYGVNANQVFQWRRLYRDGKLGAAPMGTMKLLPVSVADDEELLQPEPDQVVPACSGAIHIELPGEVRISVEGSVDRMVVRAVLKSLRS